MFAIPSKEGSHVDWDGPLRAYLVRLYGSSTDFSADASALQAMRSDALGSSRNAGGRDLLYRYFVQLDNLSLRIPINEHGCKVAFTWRDLYGKKEITQFSAAFEKAAILFNLAATCWQIGLDTEDNKVGFASFQGAAGIYNLLAENFIYAPSPDFEAETTKTLKQVCLGHAQALFIQNSLAKAPSSLLYRLAKGASIVYNEAAEGLEKAYQGNSWGERHWQHEIRFIGNYWNAFAHYHYALHLDAKEHGLALAYMKEAKSLFRDINTEQYSFKFASAKDVTAYLEFATSKAKEMEKDNDLLYHERVPPISGEISHTFAANPTAIDKIYSGGELERVIGRELFANVVPLEVHETASLYSEELAKLSRQQQEKVSVANQELTSALEYLDLPRSARILKDPKSDPDEGVPSAVAEWSHQVSTAAPLNFDFGTKHQILALVESFPESQHQQRQRIKANLVQAANQDETLKQQYESIKSDIQELGDMSTLKRLFSKPSGQQSDLLLDLDDRSGIDSQLTETLDMCSKLRKIEKERGSVFSELKQRLIDDDISSALVANRKSMKPQQIFEKEMEKFGPFTKRISATINHQRTLLAELTHVWKSVLANPQVKRDAAAREEHLNDSTRRVDRYRNVYQTWLGLHEGVTQAREFYSQLFAQAQSLANTSNSSSGSFNLDSLSSNLPSTHPPNIPARPDISAYSTPSAYSSDLYGDGRQSYGKPPLPPK